MKHKKQKKRERGASSESSSDESPPRHRKKNKDMSIRSTKEEQRTYSRHRDGRSPEQRKKHRGDDIHANRKEERHSEKRRDHSHRESSKQSRSDKRNEHDKKDARPPKIKREEDFDKRQDELQRKRKEGRREESRLGNPLQDVHVKQDPESNEGRRRQIERSQDSQGSRNRQRRDIEKERRENDARRAEAWQRREAAGGGNAEALVAETEEPKEKEKPNLGLSGALTEDTNTFRGVVIKYSEPPEARVPKKKWRLYPFKGDEALKVLHLHRQSAYLLGRTRRIADIPIDHPSCSKQHAVFQFRLVEEEKEDGSKRRIVKPYIIDLESGNGTYVNNQKIDPRRYVELKEQDVIKFGYSSREYVLIHDKSDTSEVVPSGSDDESSDE